MKSQINWASVFYITGLISLIIGIIDPLEGSLVITVGSVLLAISTYKTKDRYRKFFFTTMAMIITGVFFLFYFSWLGGFGGKSTLSLWWGTLILPYPIGWLTTIVLLIIRFIKKLKHKTKQ